MPGGGKSNGNSKGRSSRLLCFADVVDYCDAAGRPQGERSPSDAQTLNVLAPRIKLEQVHGRSLMIHAGGDNLSDTPEKLGGGGARVACGAIAKP